MAGTDLAEDRTIFYLTFLAFLFFFFFVGALFEKYKPKLGHETGASVVAGIIWSFIFLWLHGQNA